MNSEGTQPYIFRSFWFKILTKYAGIFSPAWRLLPIHFLNPSRESFLDLIAVIFLLFCVWLCCPFCSQGDLISNLFLKALIYMELLVRYMKNMVPKCWPCRRCFSPICFTLSYGYVYQCFPLWFLDLEHPKEKKKKKAFSMRLHSRTFTIWFPLYNFLMVLNVFSFKDIGLKLSSFSTCWTIPAKHFIEN